MCKGDMFCSQLVGPTLGRVRNPGCTGSLLTCAIRSSAHCWTKAPGVAPPASCCWRWRKAIPAHSRQKSLNRFGPPSSDLAASSSPRRPASVILIRPTAIALPVSLRAVASPARTSLVNIWRVKPWACMIASVAPNGLMASNRSARRCSPPRRRFRGLAVIVCDIAGIAGKAPPVRAGQVKGGRSHECPVRTFPDVSESSAGDRPLADARLKKGPNKPSRRHCFVAFVPAPRRRTDGACGSFGPRIGSCDTGQECRGQECRTQQLGENCKG
jgi:hypothetical protein